MRAQLFLLATAPFLAGCAATLGTPEPGSPEAVGRSIGDAARTVGAVTGMPLLGILGSLAEQAWPFVATGGVAALFGKRAAVKAEKARKFTPAEVAELKAALASEAPKA